MGFKRNIYGSNFDAQLFIEPKGNIAEEIEDDTFNYEGYNYVTVPTDATIVRNGQCSANYTESNPGEANLWSALGVTYNNRLVVLSSSSVYFKRTTPYDLCLVFKSLGVKDAIRLDGGSSAALSINGSHVNPLLGLNQFVTGDSARRILYALSLH